MKLVRFGPPGQEKPGLIDSDNRIRDLSGVVPDITSSVLSADGLKKIRGVDPKSLPAALSGTRLGPCVGRVGNFVAVGLNFADHAAETGSPIPAEPILFNKAPSCIVGPNDDVIIPRRRRRRTGRSSSPSSSASAPATCDETMLSTTSPATACATTCPSASSSLNASGQWMKGKGCPTFGPLGPWLVTKDEIPDVQKLAMWLDVNGERRQSGSTNTMIFDCAQLVSYISHFMILEPGDVITTGTPPGVGLGMKPPRFLKPGDVVTLGIEGLGEQRQQIVDYHEQATG